MNSTRALCVASLLAPGFLSAEVLLVDDYSYPDGQLSIVATNDWKTHSGGVFPLEVVGGKAKINQPDFSQGGEDVHRDLSVSYDPNTDNSTKLYAAFTVNFTALPDNTFDYTAGSYFAHFKSSALNEFYGRVGANTLNAEPGKFRLAVANESWNPTSIVQYPMDLELNVTYEVVIRLDLATDQTTLWIGPVDESSTSVTATDIISYPAGSTINAFALRQGTSGVPSTGQGVAGTVFIDNLRVANSFIEVVPEPAPLTLMGLAGMALLVLRRNRA